MEKVKRMIMEVLVKESYRRVLNGMNSADETLQKDLTKARFMAIINPIVIPQVNILEKQHRIWEDMIKVVEDIVNLDWIHDEDAESKYNSLNAHWENLQQEREKTKKEFESLY